MSKEQSVTHVSGPDSPDIENMEPAEGLEPPTL
jgi:hypothetical protein